MRTGYYYTEGFCRQDRYRGLYPVEYVQDAEKQPYKRKCMSCGHVTDGTCEHMQECDVIDAAPEIMPVDQEWKIGEKMKVEFR